MLAFRLDQRVYIKDTHPLKGWTGKVACLMPQHGSAYLQMDDPLPAGYRRFAAAHDSRRNWLEVQPEDCEEIP
jgi:hypothetical protein